MAIPAFKDSSDYGKSRREFLEKYQLITHLILSPEEYQNIFAREKSAILAHPGDIPDAAAIGATADARSQASEALKRYQFASDNYKHQETMHHQAKLDWLEACPTSVKQLLSDPDKGTMHISIGDILVITDTKFKTITADTLHMAESELPTSCGVDPESVRQAACKCTSFHTLCSKAGQAQSEFQKVSRFMAILPEPDFDLFKRFYKRAYPILADQKFDTLVAEAITEAESMIQDNLKRRANSITTSHATKSTHLHSYDEFMANAARAAVAAGLVPPTVAGPPPGPGTANPFYCWTHGPNTTHHSQDCKFRHPKHNAAATFANKRNGRTDTWTKHGKPGP
jgi:hypothetical protein